MKRATVLSSSEEDNDDDSDDEDNRYRVSYVSYKTLVFYPTLSRHSIFHIGVPSLYISSCLPFP